MKAATVGMLALFFTGSVWADRPQDFRDSDHHGAQSAINVVIGGLNCSTTLGAGTFAARNWSWGAANSSTAIGGGSGIGKTTVSALQVKKDFDACSPALFGAASTARHFATLNLTQQDANGNTVVTVRMTDVLVTSWTVGGEAHDASPDEVVQIAFRKVCLSGGGTGSFCFDVATQQST